MSCFCIKLQKDVVKTLDFRHCGLAFIPEEVYTYDETLEELCLDSNNIKDLPRSLFHCQFLRKLSVCDNDLRSVPNTIAGLVNLEQLDISKNGVIELPDSIKCCKNLDLVEISVNPLGRLPEGFTQLINLTQLYLNDTLLNFLPANFGRLIKLKVLELRENKLKALPRSMSRLTELERLDLGMNEFRQLPEVIGFYTKLTELWLDSNKLTALAPLIGHLKQLEYLDASCNRIEIIPEEIDGLDSLTDLHLSKNYLQDLPKSIGLLSNLQNLKLDSNQILKLPYSIGGLVSLEELILTSNELEELPPSIGLLRKLVHLNVDQNMLLDLPPELGSCSSISLLSLQSNLLRTIPDELGRITGLTVVNLSNNELRYLPYNFTKIKKLQALWLSENQSKPLIPLQSEMRDDLGQRVLTCFLLPQHRREPDDDVYQSDGESFHVSLWEEQRLSRRQIAFDVSESDSEHKLRRAPTPYPKEPFRRKVQPLTDGQPGMSSSEPSSCHKDARDSPESHQSRSSVRSVHGRRSRSPGSPISAGLQLFQADKELMAKDKVRLRGSSSSLNQSDSESVASLSRERVMGRREIKARVDPEALVQSPVWSHMERRDLDQRQSPQHHALDVGNGFRHRSVGQHLDYDPPVQNRKPFHNRGYESDIVDVYRSESWASKQREVHNKRSQQRGTDVGNSRGYESDHPRGQDLNRNHNASSGVGAHQFPPAPRRRYGAGRSGYSTDPEGTGYMSSRTAKQARDPMLPPPYHRVQQLRLPNDPTRRPSGKHLRPQTSQQLKDYGWIDNQLPSTPEGRVVNASHGTVPGLPSDTGYRPPRRYRDKPSALSDTELSSTHRRRTDYCSPSVRAELSNNVSYRPSKEWRTTDNIAREKPHNLNRYSDNDSSDNRRKANINGAQQDTPNHADYQQRRRPIVEGDEQVFPKRQNATFDTDRSSQRQKDRHGSQQGRDYIETREPRDSADRDNLNNRRCPVPTQDHTKRDPNPRGSHSLPRDINGYQPTGEPVADRRTTSDVRGYYRVEADGNRRSSVGEGLVGNRSLEKSTSEPEMKQHPQEILARPGEMPTTDSQRRNLPMPKQFSSPIGDSYSQSDSGTLESVPRTDDDHSLRSRSPSKSPIRDLVATQLQSRQQPWDKPYRNNNINPSSYEHGKVPLQSIREYLPEGTAADSSHRHMDATTNTHSDRNPHGRRSAPHGALTPLSGVDSQGVRSPDATLPRQHSHPTMQGPPWGQVPMGADVWPQDSSGYASDQNETSWKRASCSTPTSSVFQSQTATWRPGSDITPSAGPSPNPASTQSKPHPMKQMPVVIYKNPGLGFSITGGSDFPGNPFHPHDMGIFVTKIKPSGPADGVLRPGDKLLEVNGRSYASIRHNDAVKLLRKSNPVSMVIERDDEEVL